jgi:hypothetical protein
MKRDAIFGNGRSAAVLFVILVIFLSASLALASNTSQTAQPVPLPADQATVLETNLKLAPVVQNDLPPNCTEGIVNGGFEGRTGWITTATQYTAGYATDPEPVRSGVYSMRTGIVNPAHNIFSYSSALQTVTLPADADYITLNFWIFPQTGENESIPLRLPRNPLGIQEADATTVSDWQFVFILNQYGQELERLLYRRQNVEEWQFHSFDLSQYAGRTIKVYFDTFNNGLDGITSMHIDDVSLAICTGTPPEPEGSIAGTVNLQGRSDHSGAEVCADDGSNPVCVQSDASGAYAIDVAPGSYAVTVDMERYLDAEMLNVAVTTGNVTNLPEVTCLGGDTNDDCVINILDLSLAGGRFGTTCSDSNWDPRADINDDCVINILDLSIAGGNFGKSCPVPWK